jgi:leucyl aminopeptidase
LDIRVASTPLSGVRADALVLLVAKGEDLTARVRRAGRGFVSGHALLRERRAFDGDGTTALHGGGGRVGTLVLAGLGDARKAGPDAIRRAAAEGARAARDAGARSMAVAFPDRPAASAGETAQAIVEGVRLGLYVFEAYRSEKAKKAVSSVTVLAPRAGGPAVRRGVEEGNVLAESVLLVRDLGNEPGNVATPTYLAERAKAIAAEHGLKVQVLEEADMKALGMGALLGVAKGSEEPAKLIVLTHEPARRRGRVPTVAVVGKGLTFDSGGISIKPAAQMEEMKFDMCGGAAVLGILQAVARLRLPLRVVGLVPASENLPDGASYKPGDILKAMNGTTIEVVNTDAEGRLILADALAYATSRLRPRPDAVVDLATLTGACVVALGNARCGLVSNDDRLAERIERASEGSGDAVWRLPIEDAYRERIKSVYADIRNSAGREGGALTAAAFLERFVGGVPWAHMDIAGTAWTDATKGVYSKGATGFGVRVVVRMLQAFGRGLGRR